MNLPQMMNQSVILEKKNGVDEEQLRQQLIHLRKNESKLTQKELAALAGIEERTLQKLEGGKPVKQDTKEAVASALGYELQQLYYLKKK